ncbi:hypothetical protein MBLNU457_2163t1 [Dothideomycetes sp. NU457]
MDGIVRAFAQAQEEQNGYALAQTISPVPPNNDSGRLYAIYRSVNAYSVQNDLRYALNSPHLDKGEVVAWVEVYVAYWKAVGAILAAEEAQNVGDHKEDGSSADWTRVYESWKEVLNAVRRGYQTSKFDAWTIPCLYVTSKYLRVFAIKADNSARHKKDNNASGAIFGDDMVEEEANNEKLEDAARQINSIFGLCLSDRAPLEDSRKYGVYYIASLLFKTYFRLNSISLSKNILRPIAVAAGDMPPLDVFPKSHQVTFNYYVGVVHFLDEDYPKAEEYLSKAYDQALATSTGNIQLILTYLIPIRLITNHKLPSSALLAQYPSLERLFAPVCKCIKRGDLAGFDAAIQAGEDEFVKRRILLTLERGRDICVRNVFRKVFLAGGFELAKEGEATSEPVRRVRIPIDEFTAGLRLAGEKDIDRDEVECFLANMIYKNHMKGYISRAHAMVVLNKKGAFPGTGV